MRFFFSPLLACAALAPHSLLKAQIPIFEDLGTFKANVDLQGPAAKLINRGDGYFYGLELSEAGGIYRLTPGGEKEILHRFLPVRADGDSNSGGARPTTPLILGPDGSLYGATGAGGGNGKGCIYRLSADGIFSVIKDIDAFATPVNSLLITPDGDLYGTIPTGGSREGGTLFKIGSDRILRTHVPFSNQAVTATPGVIVRGDYIHHHHPDEVALGSDGNLYVRCQSGGPVYDTPSGVGYRTFGGRFRVQGFDSITRIYQGNESGIPDFNFPAAGGFIGLSGGALRLLKLDGDSSFMISLNNLPAGNLEIRANASTEVYGLARNTTSGRNAYLFHRRAGLARVVHTFSESDELRHLALTIGNDGSAYGVLSYRPGDRPIAPAGSTKKQKAEYGLPRMFRLNASGSASDKRGPLANTDSAWLPAKASGGQREVLIDLLKNDSDPNGDALVITALDEVSGNASASIVVTPKGQRLLRYTSSEADPASRVIGYTISDEQGGFAKGIVSIKSPVSGKFGGVASNGEGAEVPLTLSFGKKNQITASLTLGGVKYSGKGALGGDDSADLTLVAKGQPAINLHCDVQRGIERQIVVTLSTGETAYSGSCVPIAGKKR